MNNNYGQNKSLAAANALYTYSVNTYEYIYYTPHADRVHREESRDFTRSHRCIVPDVCENNGYNTYPPN